MLTTIIFTVTCGGDSFTSPTHSIVQRHQSIEDDIIRRSESVISRSSSGQSPSRSTPGPQLDGPVSLGRSLLRVSEHETSAVPAGTAAVYWESGRPIIDSDEARVLNSMLDALSLSATPEAYSSRPGSRAFKISRVSNEDAVNPRDEASQSIYSSIHSTISGI